MKVSPQVFREAFTVHYVAILGSLGAGFILSGLSNNLQLIPGLALLLPGALGSRGTIMSSLGSRLSSAMHLGEAGDFSLSNPVIRKNADLTHKATLFISLVLGFFAAGLAKIFNISADPFLLTVISVGSGALSGVIMIVITNIIAFQTFNRGWDPDNVTAPFIATLGDFITVPILFGVAMIVNRFSYSLILVLAVVSIIYTIWEVRREVWSARFLVLIPSISFQVIAGLFLERSLGQLLNKPGLIAFLPVFLSQGGNLASILAARLSTQLHLGTLKPEFRVTRHIIGEVLTIIALGTLIFPFLGITVFAVQRSLHLPHMQLLEILRIVLEAGFLNILIVAVFLGYSISIFSWRLNLDPDDITIPLLSALADLFGILFLLLVI